MFSVDASAAAAIRQAFIEGGELSAAIELRRYFPGIADNANARRCARIIAGWLPVSPPTTNKLRKKRVRQRSSGATSKRGG